MLDNSVRFCIANYKTVDNADVSVAGRDVALQNRTIYRIPAIFSNIMVMTDDALK